MPRYRVVVGVDALVVVDVNAASRGKAEDKVFDHGLFMAPGIDQKLPGRGEVIEQTLTIHDSQRAPKGKQSLTNLELDLIRRAAVAGAVSGEWAPRVLAAALEEESSE